MDLGRAEIYKEDLMKKSLARVLTLALAAMMLLSACGAPPPDDGGTSGNTGGGTSGATGGDSGSKSVVLAMAGAWGTMMPFNDTGNYGDLVYGQIYDKLVYHNGDYTISPRLAETWEPNEDRTAITMTLNKNATWHDGEPLTANDVVFTVDMVTNPDVQATKRSNFMYLRGCDDSGAFVGGEDEKPCVAEDDYTVTFHFKNPSDPDIFMYQFCRNFYVVPQHIWGEKSIEEINNADNWAKTAVGSGPFKFVNEISGERITLEANKDYFQGAPDFDTLILRNVLATNMLAGLQTGEIDIIAGGGIGSLALDDWEAAKADENLETFSHPTLGYQVLNLNMSKDYLTDGVRQAICMAVNRQAIVDGLLFGEGEVLDAHMFAKNHPYYQGENVRKYDPEEAKALLEADNWDSSRVLSLMVPSGNVVRERSALLIQQDLEAIGIKVEITTVDFPTLMAETQKPDGPDLNLIGSAGSLDPEENAQWFNPAGATNFSCFPANDLDLFNYYVEGAKGTSREERKPIYDEMQKAMLESGCRLYMYVTNALVVYNPRLSGMDIESFASVNWDTWKWKVAD